MIRKSLTKNTQNLRNVLAFILPLVCLVTVQTNIVSTVCIKRQISILIGICSIRHLNTRKLRTLSS